MMPVKPTTVQLKQTGLNAFQVGDDASDEIDAPGTFSDINSEIELKDMNSK